MIIANSITSLHKYEKREIKKKKTNENETKTEHEEVTRNGRIMDSVMVLENGWQEKPSSLEESGDVFILLLKLLY